jgi:hypothetical protein
VQRDAHQGGLHDCSLGERPVEIVRGEARDAGPQRDEWRCRLLRLEARERLDRRDDAGRRRLDQVLPGQGRPIQVSRRQDEVVGRRGRRTTVASGD